MDKCFFPCGCEDFEGITKSDLDRFTDKIENVLNDEKGKKLFRHFMYTSKRRDGRRTLDFWEQVDSLLGCKETAESLSYPSYLEKIDSLISKAEKIEELDFATMERLIMARNSENKEDLTDVLKILKIEATKALRNEYNAFRIRFVTNKN